MLNEVALVGRLTKNPEVTELEGGKKISSIIIAVPRMYKNSSGLYDTDYIRVTLWNGIALNTREYCHCGDLIGIKGRIQVNNFVDNASTSFLNSKYVLSIIFPSAFFILNAIFFEFLSVVLFSISFKSVIS